MRAQCTFIAWRPAPAPHTNGGEEAPLRKTPGLPDRRESADASKKLAKRNTRQAKGLHRVRLPRARPKTRLDAVTTPAKG